MPSVSLMNNLYPRFTYKFFRTLFECQYVEKFIVELKELTKTVRKTKEHLMLLRSE